MASVFLKTDFSERGLALKGLKSLSVKKKKKSGKIVGREKILAKN